MSDKSAFHYSKRTQETRASQMFVPEEADCFMLYFGLFILTFGHEIEIQQIYFPIAFLFIQMSGLFAY